MKKNLFFLVSLLLFTACSIMKKETLQEIAEHTEVSYVLSDEQRDIVSASNDFGLLLFKQLVKTNPDSSLILSPMGVVYNLNMLNNGAGGTTLQEICKVLGYKPTDLSRVNALNRLLLIGQRKQMKRSDREVKGYMQTSNLLAINKQFPINEAFKDSLSHYYFADVLAASDVETMQKRINEWSTEQTEGKITELPVQLSNDIKVCLVNTVVFVGLWEQSFWKEETRAFPFHLANGKTQKVQMMHGSDNTHIFSGMRGKDFSALRMPYQGAFYFTVLLPDSGLTIEHLLADFNTQSLQAINNGLKKYNEVYVDLPKFSSKTTSPLKDLLQSLGIRNAFSEQANFASMSTTPLKVDNIVQQTEIRVDEKGTEAQSESMTMVTELSALSPSTKFYFTANRPFVYYISDAFGNICFIGKYNG